VAAVLAERAVPAQSAVEPAALAALADWCSAVVVSAGTVAAPAPAPAVPVDAAATPDCWHCGTCSFSLVPVEPGASETYAAATAATAAM
jgi:hypothetical protein